MWIGLISDTHGFLDPSVLTLFHEREVEGIVHAGDIGPGEILAPLAEIAPLVAVRGNIDSAASFDLPLEDSTLWGGHRVGTLHIAGSSRRPKRSARMWIERGSLDVLVVGHSHIFDVGRVGSTLWINPGAAGHAGFHTERTAAFLWLAEGEDPRLEKIVLGPRGKRPQKK